MNRLYVGVDPGKTTGVAVIVLREDGSPALIRTTTITDWREVREHVRDAATFATGPVPTTLVLEEFRATGRSSKKQGESWSTKCNGTLEQLAYRRGWECVYQTSSDAKTTVSDKVLRESMLGGNSKHEGDAMRHALRYLATHGNHWARGVLAGRH